MNAKKVKKIKTHIESLEQILEAVEDLRDEENYLLDGMPDNLRYTQQYERAEAAHESLDTACDSLSDTIDSLKEI